MWILLVVICAVIPYISILYLTEKMEKFIERGGFSDEKEDLKPSVLIMGKTDLAKQVAVLFSMSNLQVIIEADPLIPEKGQNFQYLLALSDIDVDNILMCRMGERFYQIHDTFSICNDRQNKIIYEAEKLPYSLREDITAQGIVQSVLKGKRAAI